MRMLSPGARHADGQAADEVRKRVLKTQRHRDTDNAQAGDHGGDVHVEAHRQHAADADDPHDDAHEIDEDGAGRQKRRLVQHAAHKSHGDARDDEGDRADDHDAEQGVEPIVGLPNESVCGHT